ncbi:hypothetical protein BpHYR1_016969 [Brachionus plicatilis]|uniref:Uncharacterized protein n=1 Tax=Brachionus plicatilis TaxID=10195 RepID=A0A3M7S9M8_BRAPC|nr:hypothetical protein BpHYR1_016969 [Brachionus plicatilis]
MICLLFVASAYFNHIVQVLKHRLQQLNSRIDLSFEKPEQRVFDILLCSSNELETFGQNAEPFFDRLVKLLHPHWPSVGQFFLLLLVLFRVLDSRTFSALFGRPSQDGVCCCFKFSTHSTKFSRLTPSGMLNWHISSFTNLKSFSKLLMLNNCFRNVFSKRLSNTLSILPPYTHSDKRVKMAGNGTLLGGRFVRPMATVSIQTSIVSRPHLRSDSLNS